MHCNIINNEKINALSLIIFDIDNILSSFQQHFFPQFWFFYICTKHVAIQGILDLREFCVHGILRNLNFLHIYYRSSRYVDFQFSILISPSLRKVNPCNQNSHISRIPCIYFYFHKPEYLLSIQVNINKITKANYNSEIHWRS